VRCLQPLEPWRLDLARRKRCERQVSDRVEVDPHPLAEIASGFVWVSVAI
jgi:hypothetical protein